MVLEITPTPAMLSRQQESHKLSHGADVIITQLI